jgi:pyruvate, water dikinase
MKILQKLRFFGKNPKADEASPEKLMQVFRRKYANFRTLLDSNTQLLKIIGDIEHKLNGQTIFGPSFTEAQTMRSIFHSARMIDCLEKMSGRPYPLLHKVLEEIHRQIKFEAGDITVTPSAGTALLLPYSRIGQEETEAVGAKNAHIGEIMNRLGIPTPRGFAITTAAFRHYITFNNLTETILRMKAKADLIEAETILQVSQEIQHRLSQAEVPPDLTAEIYQAHAQLTDEIGSPNANISMRSSALGEDSAISFAGQYLTVLNVPAERLLQTYKRIIASLFTPHAISYRLHMAITFQEAVMAVACQEMIEARVSGVMYTRNPIDPLENRILIKAVWGLGPYVVEGVITPDTYVFSKDEAPRLLESKIADKAARLIALVNGDLCEEPVPEHQRRHACLPEDQARRLAEYGLRLEAHFGKPQDVEWALDPTGRLVLLQARPLRVGAPETGNRKVRGEPLAGYSILMQGGDIGCVGVGTGPVFPVATESDLAAFPDGAVLVSATASPQLVMAMPKARAILTDTGNIAGHMSSLAREYMVPTILNLGDASKLLVPGTQVTVDAFNARVYLGHIPELTDAAAPLSGVMHNTPTYNALRRRAELIVPLNLKDPKAPDFTPAHCRTIHDIMRFIHEKSYEEIFQLGDLVTDRGKLSVRLQASLPLDLYIIDLGLGLRVDAARVKAVRPEDIVSAPFGALLKGMMREDLTSREPRPIHLGGFFSVMGRQLLTPPHIAAERFGDRSYAIISDRYLNFSSRVGYHYSVLDSYCGQTAAKNYINFQFKGGAADELRRNRRARVIEKVLVDIGFMVNTVVDRVTARLDKLEASQVQAKLDMLGRLLIFTRQMDMLMHSEAMVAQMAECFLSGNYNLDPQGAPVCRI